MGLFIHIEEAGYEKNEPILENIHFSVNGHELVGLIGPNGAGKSTTIKAILGILKHVKGEITVPSYSYIPERPIFYDRLTLWEHIEFLYSTLTVNEKEFFNDAEELVRLFKMDQVKHHYPDHFSKGMQQKMMLILAFLKKPDLYIIDEPFMGLDPKSVKKLQLLLEEEKRRGAAILMSTHVLDSAEKMCDRFVFITDGKLLAQGTLEDIRQLSGLKDGSLLDCFDILIESEEQ